jgi:hypothetical protein
VNTKQIEKVRYIILAALLTAGPAALAGDPASPEQDLRAAIEQFGVGSQAAAAAAKEAQAQIEVRRSAEEMATASASKVPAHLLIDLGY